MFHVESIKPNNIESVSTSIPRPSDKVLLDNSRVMIPGNLSFAGKRLQQGNPSGGGDAEINREGRKRKLKDRQDIIQESDNSQDLMAEMDVLKFIMLREQYLERLHVVTVSTLSLHCF